MDSRIKRTLLTAALGGIMLLISNEANASLETQLTTVKGFATGTAAKLGGSVAFLWVAIQAGVSGNWKLFLSSLAILAIGLMMVSGVSEEGIKFLEVAGK